VNSPGPITLRVAAHDLPLALAALHRESEVGDRFAISIDIRGSVESMPTVESLIEGSGFSITGEPGHNNVGVTRLRSLPDYIATNMRVLTCGLNPSLHSADLRVGFGRAGNRFWPAALDAGLVTIDRDPIDALANHRVGMTDMVKRASPRADALTREEYTHGLARLDDLCGWLRPAVVCMVGLAGWRAATDRKAIAGVQQRRLGGSSVYVMPSTSGLNAHSSLADLTSHLQKAAELADLEISRREPDL